MSRTTEIFDRPIPSDFKFGVATASYQIEGAWDEDGKGENIWDHICHTNPDFVLNRDNGDIACDSYHKYEEDVRLLKELGVDFYRFSLSWSRILPNGYANQINLVGVQYYKNLISLLLENGIEPVVTIFHWDLPQTLQDIGGWAHPDLEYIFADYARVVFEQFGDNVKQWLTFNEPVATYQHGYGIGVLAPGIKSPGSAEYRCVHNMLKAHARAYHLYDEEFRATQKGLISLTNSLIWFEPANPESDLDREAAERTLQFDHGLFANPIYNRNYPQIVIDIVREKSAQEGYKVSRLPEFTPEELDYISGTYDFLGVNMYTTKLAEWCPDNVDSTYRDLGVKLYQDESWKKSASFWLKVTPWAMRKGLNWLKKTYNNPKIIIFENGFSDRGELDDQDRIDFHKEYLSNVLAARMDDGVNVIGYTAWSLIDNFEWQKGYSEKFGLYHVDFNDPDRERTPKASAKYYANVIRTRRLVDSGPKN